MLHGRRDALEPAHGAEADVEIEDLAERDVQRADAAADRRRERALDADEVLRGTRRAVSSGSQFADLVERLLAGEDLVPGDLPLAAVGLLDRGVEHARREARQMSGPVPSPSMNGMTG